MNDCFGLISVFCADSDVCKACPDFGDCALACRAELLELSNFENLDKVLKKHEKTLHSLGLIEDTAKPVKRRQKKSEGESTEQMEQTRALCELLQAKELIRDGWIAEDLSQAPAGFRFVVETLKRYETINSSELVKSIGYKLLNKAEALAQCAIAIQVLSQFNLVSTQTKGSKQVITWKLS